ncbi:MAG: hypothetical protein KAS39_03205, partial [Actinomycetia bacterium]|nr:hypothetical protein [Actinomycetes bacterium]
MKKRSYIFFSLLLFCTFSTFSLCFAGSLSCEKKVQDMSKADASRRIDFSKLTWYAKEGLVELNPGKEKIDLSEYKKIKKLPIFLNKEFNVPVQHSIKEYTLFTEFDLSSIKDLPQLAIYISAIGENWKIFLN